MESVGYVEFLGVEFLEIAGFCIVGCLSFFYSVAFGWGKACAGNCVLTYCWRVDIIYGYG